MAGAGSTKAGTLPMGQETYEGSTGVTNGLRNRHAPMFDLKTKTFPRDAEGKVIMVHWVDQAVALALGVFNGAHASDTKLGNRLKFIPRNAPNKLQAEVEDAVRIALKNLTDAKHIGVTRIEIDTSTVRGRNLVAVYYINRRLYTDAERKYQFVLG